MPTEPGITLTVTLTDLSGVDVDGGALLIRLCGYGQTLPRIAGTSMLAKISTKVLLANGSSAGISLWGNDQITPAGTYYAIEVLDSNRNIVQAGIYQLNGAQTVDLSTATQIVQPPTPPPPVPPGNWFADSIVPSGVIDGVNPTFTLPQAPSPAESLKLYKNGQRLTQGVAYSLNGETITYANGYIPQAGDSHICDFRYHVA